MSMIFKSLSGLDSIGAGELQNNHRITVITAGGMQNVTWGNLSQAIIAPLESRISALEASTGDGEGGGVPGPSIWPAARTLSLTGAVAGSVSMDGSQNVSMSTVIEDGSLTMAKVNGLQTKIDELSTAVANQWGTGYTNGPFPTTFAGNLNTLSGATYLYTQSGATNVPAAGDPFVILQNGPQNFGQQIGLRAGELYVRGQNLGAWGGWNRAWTSANLDPATLLLKTDTASAATKLATARSFALTGLVTATAVNFDGTGNVSLTTAIANNALAIAKTSGLQAALDVRLTLRGAAGSVSLNTITTAGIYSQTAPTSATTVNQYPVASELGTLVVYAQGTIVTQVYHGATSRMWTRHYDGSAWTPWNRSWSTTEFNPNTKYDKTGGTISGDLQANNITGLFMKARTFNVDDIALMDSAPYPVFQIPQATGAVGIYAGETFMDVGRRAGNAHLGLRIYNDGRLTNGVNGAEQALWHTGTFDPEYPVQANGLLTIGPKTGERLMFRKDGQYSKDGGTTWKEINEAPQVITNPRYATLAIGDDNDLLLYQQVAGTLSVRSGSEAGYRYFNFRENGNFEVLNGRVLIGEGQHEAWHAGNFNPTNKLDTTATAAAATKLATARRINGQLFDGTADITVASQLAENSTLEGLTYFRVKNGSTGQARFNAYTATGASLEAVNVDGSGYAPLNLHGTTVTITGNEVWHGGNFNPANKLASRSSLFTSAEIVADWNNATNNGWYMASGATNAPPVDGNWVIGMVTVHNGDWIQQEVWQFTAGPSEKRWRRYKSSGTWGAWTSERTFGVVVANAESTNKANFVAQLPALTQAAGLAFYWGANRIWQQGLEANGDFKLWSYTDAGVYQGNPLSVKGNGSVGVSIEPVASEFSRLSVGGGIKSYGSASTLGVMSRDSGVEWNLYANLDVLRIWREGSGDLVTVNNQGALSAGRLSTGWDSGMLGSVSCSNWFRSSGDTGVYFADYGGGWHMTDTTFIRAYNGKHVAAADFHVTSDLSLKENIQHLPFRGRLQPVSFDYIDGEKNVIGFIANWVEELYPEAVMMDPTTKKRRLSQGKLTAVLASQSNMQGDQITKLELQVDDLRGEIEALKQLVANLRQ